MKAKLRWDLRPHRGCPDEGSRRTRPDDGALADASGSASSG
jgi:hypothetical protein